MITAKQEVMAEVSALMKQYILMHDNTKLDPRDVYGAAYRVFYQFQQRQTAALKNEIFGCPGLAVYDPLPPVDLPEMVQDPSDYFDEDD